MAFCVEHWPRSLSRADASSRLVTAGQLASRALLRKPSPAGNPLEGRHPGQTASGHLLQLVAL